MVDEVHVDDLIPAYALGSLDDEEARRVAAHLAGCEQCQKEFDQYQSVVGQLALSTPIVAPSPNLKQHLMAQINKTPVTAPAQKASVRRPAMDRRPFQRLVPVFAIAAVVLILALSATTFLLLQQVNRPMATLVGPNGMRAIALQSSTLDPQSSGIVIVSSDGENGVLVVDDFKQLDSSQQYQAWLMKNGQYTPGPLFTVDKSGYRGMRIQAPDSLLSYDSILVTIEPASGSSAPTGPEVLSGSLHNQ